MKDKGLYFLIPLILLWAVLLINPDGFLYEDDEGAYLYISASVARGDTLYKDILAAKPPLLFLIGSVIYKIAGNNIIIYRYSSSIAALFCALMIFHLVRQYTGPFVALICSIMLLFDPVLFTQARFFRTDIFMLLFLIGSYFFLSRYKRTIEILAGTFLALIAVLTRDDATLYAVFIIGYFAIKNRDKRLIVSILSVLVAFLISLYIRGISLISNSFQQQIDIKGFDLLIRLKAFEDFFKYLIRTYPVSILIPAILLIIVKVRKNNHSLFAIMLIIVNMLAIMLSESHYIRYTLILILARIALLGDLLLMVSMNYRNIIALFILIVQFVLNPPPIGELKFRDDTIMDISRHIKHISNRGDVLLSDYGYFNFHSDIKGTSISGYISGGNVRTGEIDAERLIKVIENENVRFLLLHTEGRLYYPYGAEIYYFEPHHIKGLKDFDLFLIYVKENFSEIKRFKSPYGPLFVLFERNLSR